MPKGITKKMYAAGKKAEKATPVSKRSLRKRKEYNEELDKAGKTWRKALYGTPAERAKRTAKKKATSAIRTRKKR